MHHPPRRLCPHTHPPFQRNDSHISSLPPMFRIIGRCFRRPVFQCPSPVARILQSLWVRLRRPSDQRRLESSLAQENPFPDTLQPDSNSKGNLAKTVFSHHFEDAGGPDSHPSPSPILVCNFLFGWFSLFMLSPHHLFEFDPSVIHAISSLLNFPIL